MNAKFHFFFFLFKLSMEWKWFQTHRHHCCPLDKSEQEQGHSLKVKMARSSSIILIRVVCFDGVSLGLFWVSDMGCPGLWPGVFSLLSIAARLGPLHCRRASSPLVRHLETSLWETPLEIRCRNFPFPIKYSNPQAETIN